MDFTLDLIANLSSYAWPCAIAYSVNRITRFTVAFSKFSRR